MQVLSCSCLTDIHFCVNLLFKWKPKRGYRCFLLVWRRTSNTDSEMFYEIVPSQNVLVWKKEGNVTDISCLLLLCVYIFIYIFFFSLCDSIVLYPHQRVSLSFLCDRFFHQICSDHVLLLLNRLRYGAREVGRTEDSITLSEEDTPGAWIASLHHREKKRFVKSKYLMDL